MPLSQDFKHHFVLAKLATNSIRVKAAVGKKGLIWFRGGENLIGEFWHPIMLSRVRRTFLAYNQHESGDRISAGNVSEQVPPLDVDGCASSENLRSQAGRNQFLLPPPLHPNSQPIHTRKTHRYIYFREKKILGESV